MKLWKKLLHPIKYTKVLFEVKIHRYDIWETEDSDGYDLYLKVYKTKYRGERRPVYRFRIPGYTVRTDDFWEGFWNIVRELDNDGPAYRRLLDEYRIQMKNYGDLSQDLRNASISIAKFHKKRREEERCQNLQKSTPNENS